MTPDEQNLDMLVAELDRENRLLRARNERLEKEAMQRAANQLDDINVVDMPAQQQEPVAWRPDVCPITGLPFFMWIEHHETGQNVPTYGGPYDSYNIPVRDKDGSYCRERYDHDLGGWRTDEVEDVGIQIVSDQAYVSDEPPASKPWVELTDVEIARIVSLAGFAPDWAEAEIATQIVRTLAQQLREKNQ